MAIGRSHAGLLVAYPMLFVLFGKKLSESIIRERLAACVNIVPDMHLILKLLHVQTDSEELVIIKTRETLLLDAMVEHVKANHEYEVPEVIALPLNVGNLKYLRMA